MGQGILHEVSELGVRGVFASLFDQGACSPKSDSPRRARTPRVPPLRDGTHERRGGKRATSKLSRRVVPRARRKVNFSHAGKMGDSEVGYDKDRRTPFGLESLIHIQPQNQRLCRVTVQSGQSFSCSRVPLALRSAVTPARSLQQARVPASPRSAYPCLFAENISAEKKGPAYAGPSLLKRVVLFMGTS